MIAASSAVLTVCWCDGYRGDVTVRRDSRLDATLLESEGDTDGDEDEDSYGT